GQLRDRAKEPASAIAQAEIDLVHFDRLGAEIELAQAKAASRVPPIHPKVRERLEAARRFYETAAVAYKRGVLTIDRVLDASRRLMEAERDAADTHGGRLAALEAFVKRSADSVKREEAKLKVGANAQPNVDEARLRLFEAQEEFENERAGAT